MTATIRWYDRFSVIYDWSGDFPYRKARKAAIDELDLAEGDVVVDLFCGTGVNFKHILPAIGTSGRLIAIDGSPGMLARAKRRLKRLGVNADRAEIHCLDLAGDIEALARIVENLRRPKVLITLALSGFDDLDAQFGRVFEALPNGSRLATMEIYFKRKTWICRLVNWIGRGDCTRRTWEPLEARASHYRKRLFPLITSTLVVAAGDKIA